MDDYYDCDDRAFTECEELISLLPPYTPTGTSAGRLLLELHADVNVLDGENL